VSVDDHSDHDHRREHGGQIYQATKLDNQWRLDKHGQGEFNTELETWIGTDQNKLFIKAHSEKSESEKLIMRFRHYIAETLLIFGMLKSACVIAVKPLRHIVRKRWMQHLVYMV
jgi:hypothetical protein